MVAVEKPVNSSVDLLILTKSDMTTTKEMKERLPLNNDGIFNEI